jgi:hypothetical protein
MRKLLILVGALLLLLGLPTGGSAGVDGGVPVVDGVAPTMFTSDPLSGGPGTRITFSGSDCQGQDLKVFVGLYQGAPPVGNQNLVLANLGTAVVSETVTPGAGGDWSGSFVVPANALPANTPAGAFPFFVAADCVVPTSPASTTPSGVSGQSHDGGGLVADYIPNTFLLVVVPIRAAGDSAPPPPPPPSPDFRVSDMGAAVAVDAVPRFNG